MGTRPRGDAGESLLEILLAIAIMGIAFAAILAGLGTAVATSGINREQADDSAYVRAIAERLEAVTPFPSCATAQAAYEAALTAAPAITPPAGASRSLAVSYWDGSDFDGNPCTSATTLHRITVTTTPADLRATAPRPLDVVKRKP